MQYFIIFSLPFLLLAVVADVRDLCGRELAGAFARGRRALHRAGCRARRLAVAVVRGAALLCRRVAGAIRGAAAGWRGAL